MNLLKDDGGCESTRAPAWIKRLIDRGIACDVNWVSDLRPRVEGLPDWWHANGNTLLCHSDAILPSIVAHPGLDPPKRAQVALGRVVGFQEFILWGEAPVVAVGNECSLGGAVVACGGASTVYLGHRINCTGAPTINVDGPA